jgi:hypothetical protein
MRTLLTLASVALLGAPAAANPLTRLDEGNVPAPCRTLARAPAPSQLLELERRISVAGCMASVALDGVQRTIKVPSAGIEPLGTAVAPAIHVLDEVIAQGEPTATILALRAKGDLYLSLAVRLRNTVPADTDATPPAGLAQHRAIRASIEPAVRPWLDAGSRAYDAAVATAEHHPEVHENRVIAHALATCRESAADARAVIGTR